jgi:C1A family cysteine protease
MGVVDNACMPYNLEANPNKVCPPYDDFYIPCATRRCSDWQNRLTKISSYTGYATMATRKEAVAGKGPLLAGMAVFNDFFAYTSGVYVKTAGASLEGYHCICVVGYDDNQQCWIVKNSWGTGWGEGGFGRIKYGQAELLIDTEWMMYSVDVVVSSAWQSNLVVTQVYASRDSQNAWAYFQGLGWRKIVPGTPDGVTNMLVLFTEARAYGKQVTIYADASAVYQAYLL